MAWGKVGCLHHPQTDCALSYLKFPMRRRCRLLLYGVWRRVDLWNCNSVLKEIAASTNSSSETIVHLYKARRIHFPEDSRVLANMIIYIFIVCTGVLISPYPDREGNKLGSLSGSARFQQHRDASCHQVFFFPARQGAEGNSRHSDRNISLFPSWLGWGLISTPIKPTRWTNVSNLFYYEITLHVSDGISVHRQEFTTVHTATGIRQTLQLYLFDKCLLLYVQSWTPDDGRKDRLKHVELFLNIINLRHWCIWLVLLQTYITMHSPMNVKWLYRVAQKNVYTLYSSIALE